MLALAVLCFVTASAALASVPGPGATLAVSPGHGPVEQAFLVSYTGVQHCTGEGWSATNFYLDGNLVGSAPRGPACSAALVVLPANLTPLPAAGPHTLTASLATPGGAVAPAGLTAVYVIDGPVGSPSPTPAPSPSPEGSPTPTPGPTPTATPSAGPTPTPTSSPSGSPIPGSTPTPGGGPTPGTTPPAGTPGAVATPAAAGETGDLPPGADAISQAGALPGSPAPPPSWSWLPLVSTGLGLLALAALMLLMRRSAIR